MLFTSPFEAYLYDQYVSSMALCLKVMLVVYSSYVYLLVGYIAQAQVDLPEDAGIRHRLILGAFWPILVFGYVVMVPRLRAQQAKDETRSKNRHSFLNWGVAEEKKRDAIGSEILTRVFW